MPYSFPPDVQQQIRDRLASGKYASEDEVLRDALDALSWEEQEKEAVGAALDALDAGDEGVGLAEAFAQVRRNHVVAGL
jgi:Arc/MetJ-type ribon-helix-helix transcriptional regulator